jgi:hypothetical protein
MLPIIQIVFSCINFVPFSFNTFWSKIQTSYLNAQPTLSLFRFMLHSLDSSAFVVWSFNYFCHSIPQGGFWVKNLSVINRSHFLIKLFSGQCSANPIRLSPRGRENWWSTTKQGVEWEWLLCTLKESSISYLSNFYIVVGSLTNLIRLKKPIHE